MISTFFWPKLEIDIFISYCFFQFFLFYCKVLFYFVFPRKISLFSSVQFSHSAVSKSLQPHGLQNARLPCPSPTPRALLKLISIASVMTSNHLILCRPLLLPPSIFPSIRAFPNELVLHIKWPKYWSFSFSISPSNEYSGLISFRIDWLAREFQKNIYFCFIDYTKEFECGSPQTVKNSSRDRNTRPPDLPLEKSLCRSGSNS